MAFDFQAAVAAANAVVEKANSSNGGGNTNYAYPLVYPQAGSTIVFRPLFNPASGQILRLVNRHEKTACYRTYNQDCPICQVMQQVKDITGQDPFGRTKASRSRGICFAQFISSTIPISKGENKGNLQPGETILAMFPWSVYQQINAVIQAAAQTPTGMDQAFSHPNSGLYLQIQVTADFKYTTTPVPYMTFPTNMSEEQFMEFLNQMPSLAEQVLPSTITEDVQKQVTEYSDAIYRQYIAPQVVQSQAPATPMGFNQAPPAPTVPQGFNPGYSAPTIPQSGGYQPQSGYGATSPTPPNHGTNVQAPATPLVSSYVPPVPSSSPVYTPPVGSASAASTTVANRPACYGKHKENDPQCICCPCEVECMQSPF